MSDTLPLLAFDTSGPWCAGAVLTRAGCVAHAEDMTRGQAERLMPMLVEMLSNAGLEWRDLSRIGVGVGPGNFTGIRIAVSAARGLALGLEVPVLGVSSFEALSAGATGSVAVGAPRDHAYLAKGDNAPVLVARADVPEDAIWPKGGAALARLIAQWAATQPIDGRPLPAPLYLRSADAAPSRDTSPVMLDDA